MKKRLISMLLTVSLLFGLLTAGVMAADEAATSGICGDNLTWAYADGVLTISGTGAMNEYEFQDIPWAAYRNVITKISLPDGLTTISSGAFQQMRNISEINLPDSLISIGNYSFAFCQSLTSIEIPEGVASIGEGTFAMCGGLTKVVLPDTVTSIGKSAFGDCIRLVEINIPGGVTSIGESAFSNCPKLAQIVIPEGVTRIENSAFTGCSALTELTIPDGVISIGSYAFAYCSSLTQVTLPPAVTAIGEAAFSGCEALQSMIIPKGVAGIEAYTFYNCGNLTTVTIPTSVTAIGRYAFEGCDNLTAVIYGGTESAWNSISVAGDNTGLQQAQIQYGAAWAKCGDDLSWKLEEGVLTISGTGAMYEYDNFTSYLPWFNALDKIEKVVVEEGVTCLSDHAFSGALNMKEASLPSTLTEISEYAFNGCFALETVNIPSGITRIGAHAFHGCFSLKELVLPDTLAEIGELAFRECIALETVYLFSGVTSIGAGTFSECPNLTDVYYGGTEANWNSIVIGENNNTLTGATIHYETGASANPFTDVASTDWYYNAVLWAVENNITQGTSATTFSPDNDCTRAQVVTFLWRAAGEPVPTSTVNPFTDVSSDEYYYNAVLWAVEKGITVGTSATEFSPNKTCTRAQVVTFLWRTAGRPGYTHSNPFTDVNNTLHEDLYNAILWAVEKGITVGTSSTTFSPYQECNRAQIVTFLYRYITGNT